MPNDTKDRQQTIRAVSVFSDIEVCSGANAPAFSGYLECGLPRCELAVALAAFDEMPAHRIPRLFRRMRADRLKDHLVLSLDTAEILPRAFRVAFKRANALAGNDQAAEKIEELDEPGIFASLTQSPDGRQNPP
jgi:hypothetical protein